MLSSVRISYNKKINMRNKERISRLLGPVGPRMWSGYWGSAASSLFHHTAIRGVQGRAVAKVSKGAVTPAKTECPRHVTCKVLAWLDSEVDVSSWKLACLEWKRCLQLQLDDIPGTWYLWRFVAKKNGFIQMYVCRISHPYTITSPRIKIYP